jgi:hypothetical protein
MLGTRHWTALSKSKQWYPVVLNMDSWLTPVFYSQVSPCDFPSAEAEAIASAWSSHRELPAGEAPRHVET